MKWFWRCLTYFNTLTNECEGGIRHTCSWFWPCCCRHCRYMYIYVCKPERRFFIFGGTYFNATRRDCCSRRVLVSCWKGWSATAPYFPHPRKRKSKSATKTQPQPVSRIDFVLLSLAISVRAMLCCTAKNIHPKSRNIYYNQATPPSIQYNDLLKKYLKIHLPVEPKNNQSDWYWYWFAHGFSSGVFTGFPWTHFIFPPAFYFTLCLPLFFFCCLCKGFFCCWFGFVSCVCLLFMCSYLFALLCNFKKCSQRQATKAGPMA